MTSRTERGYEVVTDVRVKHEPSGDLVLPDGRYMAVTTWGRTGNLIHAQGYILVKATLEVDECRG